MKLLAIHHLPTPRADDWCWGVEGEPAIPGMVCDGPGCGCDRSHIGLSTAKGSTTLRVVDSDLTRDDLEAAIAGHRESAGWPALRRRRLRALVYYVLDAAAQFPVGTVVRPTLDSDGAWVYEPAVTR